LSVGKPFLFLFRGKRDVDDDDRNTENLLIASRMPFVEATGFAKVRPVKRDSLVLPKINGVRTERHNDQDKKPSPRTPR
jgi:hypothetical protein